LARNLRKQFAEIELATQSDRHVDERFQLAFTCKPRVAKSQSLSVAEKLLDVLDSKSSMTTCGAHAGDDPR
jgi:hypothetical protein